MPDFGAPLITCLCRTAMGQVGHGRRVHDRDQHLDHSQSEQSNLSPCPPKWVPESLRVLRGEPPSFFYTDTSRSIRRQSLRWVVV